RDRDDQGDRATGGRTGDRLGGAGARRRGRQPGQLPRQGLGAYPHPAPGRRPGRGAPRDHRPPRAGQVPRGGGLTWATQGAIRSRWPRPRAARRWSIRWCARSRSCVASNTAGGTPTAATSATRTSPGGRSCPRPASREKYALGPAVLGLGHAYMAGHDVIDIAQPLMQELADYTQAAVMLAVPEGLRMLLLEVCQGDAMFNLRLEKGARVPHGTTALGRAALAARPREVFEQRLAELERTVPPEAWPKIRAGIERARKDYETYGFVFSLGDWNPDVFAVGVPMV